MLHRERRKAVVTVGIIGGSGLNDPTILKEPKDKILNTPYGDPSSPVTCGEINKVQVAILARHGRKHTIYPSAVNYRANIWALKALGCTHILASSACGSLRQAIEPGHLIFPDQFIDRTTKRSSTFYDKDSVCHIPMADPFCPQLRELLIQNAGKLGIEHHKAGTVVTIEGPRFSTKAESHLFRSWGCDVINMTTIPEATLAREAGLCYATVAMSTDYDCWHETEEDVSIEMILEIMRKNAENVIRIMLETIPQIHSKECRCGEFIKTAVIGG
jgi:5'-methylthioadenosine phosphorylase